MKAKIKPRIRLEGRTRLETVIPLKTPFIILVDPSDICNFQCKFCPTGDRELMKATPGRKHCLLDYELFKKIIDDICHFEQPIKVLRLYKDGEPLLNPHFADMVGYAKTKGCAKMIDTTTNASCLSPELNKRIIGAGLDRINISICGMDEGQYLDFSKFKIKFDKLVANIRHLYEHRGNCEIIIKINGDQLSDDDQKKFLNVFGNIADGVFVEHTMSCWPRFDLRKHGVDINDKFGIYGQPIKEVLVCPYIFYEFSINSDGSASACFLDWERKLLIGNARSESVQGIWKNQKLLAYQRLMLMKKRKSHPICGNCGQLSHGLPDNIDDFAEGLLAKLI